MVNGIQYIDYDKISDDLCWLGNKCIVRMVVRLANKGKDGTRYHFHKEFKYQSSYTNNPELITIRRSFEYYISIDHLESGDSGVMITIRDILLLRMKISEVFNWFYDKTFAIKNGKMIILEKKKPVYIDNLVGNKSLTFEPIVYTDFEDKQSKGIRITLNNPDIYTDVSANSFAGFVYIINSIDMFTAAQNMINYISHPDFGTNLYTFERSEYVGKENIIGNVIKDRTIKNKNDNRSFFDKMDEM